MVGVKGFMGVWIAPPVEERFLSTALGVVKPKSTAAARPNPRLRTNWGRW